MDNIKLYEPSMLDHFLPSIDDLAPDSQEELVEDTIL
jgi:hypothetical protein